MSDNNTNIIEQNENIMTESAPELTVEYVLEQIRAIQDNDAYLYQAISELTQMDIAGPGDIGSQAKANAIAEAVKSREETNRKLIDSYMKMYDKLTAEDNLRERILDIAAAAAQNPSGTDYGELGALITTLKNM